MPYTNETLVDHLKNNLNGGETIIYYIHDELGLGIDVGSGIGYSISHTSWEEEYIEDVISSIDALIDLDFSRSYSFDGSDIDIYCLSGHSGWNDSVLGSAWLMGGGVYSWFDIAWRSTSNSNSNQNTIIHEIGHALGLGEPGFDPLFNSTDTVMSYNPAPGGGWSTTWSSLDISALVSEWGVENDIHDYDARFFGDVGNDVFRAKSGDDFGADFMAGESGNDILIAYRGADCLFGGSGSDELRAGNGRDIITGGSGSDTMYGGFGLNTFEDEADGAVDSLYFKSDQWAENWLYGKAGNSPQGQKADKITELDSFDRIYVQGVATSQLSYGNVSHQSNLGETLSGIGIYASACLEAVYVGGNLSMEQLKMMTQGIV